MSPLHENTRPSSGHDDHHGEHDECVMTKVEKPQSSSTQPATLCKAIVTGLGYTMILDTRGLNGTVKRAGDFSQKNGDFATSQCYSMHGW